MKIVLIGYRGSGKTTVGKELAKKLDLPFFDTDKLIQQKWNKTIAQIFSEEGESGFRKKEKDVILALNSKDKGVIATGGGAILDPENCALLKQGAMTVYLQGSPQALYERVRYSKKRPPLTTLSLKKEIETVLNLRAPLYETLADVIVSIDNKRFAEVVEEVLEKVKK